ncbi:MAG TPA: FAD-dependent oxidoreductase, partial [Dehalococcoidia bacterium]|nr:FAD-dependent oxidoreductase [Dehalococcoidia bacterium]
MNPLRVAIVGAGPSGLYAAVELLRRDPLARVSMIDRLPVVGGLARFGVAPDHGVRRQVTAVYERLALSSRRFRFYGNLRVGQDLAHQDLLDHHHAVIYASGAASDRRLDIPGEDLPGCHAASEFVGWYNGHPDYCSRQFDLSADRAIVVGNGNVALDIGRLLLMSSEELRRTDMADHALAALERSRVREVVILGRRGAAQAAFTAPELLELEALADVDIVVDYGQEPAQDTNPSLRVRLIDEYARRAVRGRPRRLVLRFLGSPLEIIGQDRVEGLRIARNSLRGDGAGSWRAVPTGQEEILPAGLVFRSVGYRAEPLAGLPFDRAAAIVPNEQGRVVDPALKQACPGVFVAGWLKR